VAFPFFSSIVEQMAEEQRRELGQRQRARVPAPHELGDGESAGALFSGGGVTHYAI
jgi:hypothetical protein